VGERLPGTAGDVAAAEFARQLVEVFPRLVPALPERELKRGAVPRRFRHFLSERADELAHFRAGGVALILGGEPIINVLARAAIFHHARALQLGQMTRNARLPHPENLLQLGHGKLVLLEEKNEPEPGRVREQAQKING
jgi:hypothetical protein